MDRFAPDTAPSRRQLIVAALLLVVTLFTATTMGAYWSLVTSTSVMTDLPPWTGPATLTAVWSDSRLLAQGLLFSIPMLLVLLCHELGHYLTARYYGIRVSPPYFLPFPMALGTLGAFIRMRSAVRDKRQLFDVGIAGPIAGFVALVPFLVLGVALSQPTEIQWYHDTDPSLGDVILYLPGRSLALAGVSYILHGPLEPGWILELHPIALAAWVGLLATALNLLPLAQLDGGHILYAVVGRRQRYLAFPLWLLLFASGFWWSGWWLWAMIVLVLGLVHPPVWDEEVPLDPARRWLALVALLLLVVCFMPTPLDVLVLS